MNNPSFGNNQFEVFKRMAQQSGISGTAYIDFSPTNGFIRLKFKVMPPERQGELTSKFAQVWVEIMKLFGFQVKIHQDDAGKAGDRE
ncbi:MAG: hypothetical protein U9Q17_01010 [Chloroflexota bacterium]|nr:hypothetical protein [Chloroflexota bacterium]